MDNAVVPQMTTQAHCHVCKNSLRDGDVWLALHMPILHTCKMQRPSRSTHHDDNFSCHRCTSHFQTANDTHQYNPPTPSTPFHSPFSQKSREPSTFEPVTTQDPWSNLCPELIEVTKNIYIVAIHWNLILRILSKNKAGYNFIQTLRRTLISLIENNEIKFAMHAVMILQHILLCKTKTENDESLSKTKAT